MDEELSTGEQLAARLRASCDARIAQAIATAAQLRIEAKGSRTLFAEARDAGLRIRHALKTSHQKEN